MERESLEYQLSKQIRDLEDENRRLRNEGPIPVKCVVSAVFGVLMSLALAFFLIGGT